MILLKKKRGRPIRYRIGAAPPRGTIDRALVQIERLADAEHERVVALGGIEDRFSLINPSDPKVQFRGRETIPRLDVLPVGAFAENPERTVEPLFLQRKGCEPVILVVRDRWVSCCVLVEIMTAIGEFCGSGYPFRSPDPKIWWCQRNRITRSGARIIRGHSWNLTSGSSRRLIVRTSSVAFGGLKGSTVPGAVLPEDGRRAGGCFDARVVPGRPPSRRGLSLRAPASRYGFGSKRCGTSPTRSTG